MEVLEEDAVVPTGDGELQPAPLPRSTRKRLAALLADLAARLAQRQEAMAAPPPAPGRVADTAATGRLRDADLAGLATLGRTLLALHDATTSDLHLDAAERVAAAVRRLEVPRGGFRTAPGAPKEALDAAANGMAMRFLVELSWRIGVRGGHRDAAEKALRRLGTAAVLDASPSGLQELLAAAHALLADPLHATVVGPVEDPAVLRLHRACLALAADPLVVDWRHAGPDYPDVGRPAVYLCRGSRCLSPVTDPAALPAAAARLA